MENASWAKVITFTDLRMVFDMAPTSFMNAPELMLSTLITTVRNPDGRKSSSAMIVTNLAADNNYKG